MFFVKRTQNFIYEGMGENPGPTIAPGSPLFAGGWEASSKKIGILPTAPV